jgi:hypothetical protein
MIASVGNLLRISAIAFALSIANTAHAADGTDLTRTYLNAYSDDCAFGAAHIKTLRNYQVLLVPGYLSDLNPTYFADQLRWLAAIGVEHKKAAVASGQSIEINGTIIAKAIRDSAKPVILITHSKGSVDALEALLIEPSLRKKVSGWISLQGPFLGSPIADKLLDGSLLNPIIATVILGFFGGTRESAHGLTTVVSRAYYRERATAIGHLVRGVPVLALASAIDAAPNVPANTALEMPYELMARDNIRNDGLVPLDAAVLPGMDFIKLSGLDHIAPVMPAQQRFDRVRMTQALLLALPAPFRSLPRDAGCKGRISVK